MLSILEIDILYYTILEDTGRKDAKTTQASQITLTEGTFSYNKIPVLVPILPVVPVF